MALCLILPGYIAGRHNQERAQQQEGELRLAQQTRSQEQPRTGRPDAQGLEPGQPGSQQQRAQADTPEQGQQVVSQRPPLTQLMRILMEAAHDLDKVTDGFSVYVPAITRAWASAQVPTCVNRILASAGTAPVQPASPPQSQPVQLETMRPAEAQGGCAEVAPAAVGPLVAGPDPGSPARGPAVVALPDTPCEVPAPGQAAGEPVVPSGPPLRTHASAAAVPVAGPAPQGTADGDGGGAGATATVLQPVAWEDEMLQALPILLPASCAALDAVAGALAAASVAAGLSAPGESLEPLFQLQAKLRPGSPYFLWHEQVLAALEAGLSAFFAALVGAGTAGGAGATAAAVPMLRSMRASTMWAFGQLRHLGSAAGGASGSEGIGTTMGPAGQLPLGQAGLHLMKLHEAAVLHLEAKSTAGQGMLEVQGGDAMMVAVHMWLHVFVALHEHGVEHGVQGTAAASSGGGSV